MGSAGKVAVATGAFFLVTEVAAIGGLALYGPVLESTGYVVGPGADSRVFLGALFELVLAIAAIGTGVTLFPVIRRQNEGAALGYVCGRLLEAAVIVVGIVSLLSVVTLRRDFAASSGADAASMVTAGKTLVAIHDWTFLFGPNFILGANSLVLAYLMYRSRLVPRFIAVLGLVGGPLICVSATAVMFGLYEQLSVLGSVAAIPVFAWEITLAVRLITKGFNPSPLTSGDA
ncbi:hypothetical protein AR457_32370 [Streptomyces agglomeratus]|uniref:DUF4386 domain-containing protein n=1 Tax=Streptomyces agglomeratus TaxID=285458 RepID=UPI000852656B|nr:DUF4386 domain-containing protein [Streptomyces agglomeratus]OEJ37470.1 hypothetical protein BGK70_04280 [Streptomyces agglomeratus]OEJ48146.1 hypothetical protein AR457_32370 [Streptomyces agglomeratus]OEJ50011.1 hypothetical protein BGK72_03795 [Streptomyces agglomeratus]OEJ57340.1 hypothetical protein BGM19_04475 [Streptomyces agglomeratus]